MPEDSHTGKVLILKTSNFGRKQISDGDFYHSTPKQAFFNFLDRFFTSFFYVELYSETGTYDRSALQPSKKILNEAEILCSFCW